MAVEYHIQTFAQSKFFVFRDSRVNGYKIAKQGSNFYYKNDREKEGLVALPEMCQHYYIYENNMLHNDVGPARIIMNDKFHVYHQEWYIYGIMFNHIYNELI